ncbi:MAG: formate dehydrogenase [Betaproteobacteria bacterium HGW-Betaproteobacteria-12]|nr:MAG: formate dehydrogenase [Betaproteobacteria bacterium HGW-Betaproteobacteria-12]
MKHSQFALLLALTVASAGAWAKLTPLSEEAQAKASEAKAKAAEAAKAQAELLGKSQDRVAEKYIAAQKAKGITVKPTPIVPPAPPVATAAAAPPAAPAPAAAATPSAPAPKK